MQNPPAAAEAPSPVRPTIALFLAVFCVFSPCIRHSFINFDDPVYLLDNGNIRQGFTWQAIKWAFTTNTANNWHPLTWLSYMLDWEIFHAHVKGYYLVNVLLHAASTALLFVVLRKMTGAHWRSLFVAALFGAHPLRVESVAWASERKDVLSTLFWMLTMWAYVEWVQKSAGKKPCSRVFYLLALAFLALGLMSKPMLVTLPFALLLLDYWPLNRLGRPADIGRLLIEKIPFFLLSLAACVITYCVQQQTKAITIGLFNLSLGERIANACVSCAAYLRKFFLPLDLAIYYPIPLPGSLSTVRVIASAALLLVITLVAMARMRRQPYLFTGWLWYLGTLVPVIGLVQVGSQSMADRYTYVPMIGVAIALTWSICDACAICDAAQRWRLPAFALPAAAVLALMPCAFLTVRQIGFWKDTETAFQRSVAVTPDGNVIGRHRLGMALLQIGRVDEAISHFQKVFEIREKVPAPLLSQAHVDLAMALLKKEDFAGAEASLHAAIDLMPDNFMAHFLLGTALEATSAWDGAEAEFQETIKLQPKFEDAYLRYGEMLRNLGRWEDAAAQYEAVLRLNPGIVEAHNDLGVAYQNTGKLDKAIEQYREALRLAPDYAPAKTNLDNAQKVPQDKFSL